MSVKFVQKRRSCDENGRSSRNNIGQELIQSKSFSLDDSIKRERIFKVIVLGDSGVGKTCLTIRLCDGKFPPRVDATVGVDFREKHVIIDNEFVKMQIWDTAGQERFRNTLASHYYRNVNAVVFVYDVTKLATFENLAMWINECKSYRLPENIPMIMIGNKCDLNPIEVPIFIAQKCADSFSIPIFEVSAKEQSNMDYINSIFETLAHKLVKNKPWLPKQIDPAPVGPVDLRKKPNSNSSCSCLGVF